MDGLGEDGMLVAGEASDAGLSDMRGCAAGVPVDGKCARRCHGSWDPRRDQEVGEASGHAGKVSGLEVHRSQDCMRVTLLAKRIAGVALAAGARVAALVRSAGVSACAAVGGIRAQLRAGVRAQRPIAGGARPGDTALAGGADVAAGAAIEWIGAEVGALVLALRPAGGARRARPGAARFARRAVLAA